MAKPRAGGAASAPDVPGVITHGAITACLPELRPRGFFWFIHAETRSADACAKDASTIDLLCSHRRPYCPGIIMHDHPLQAAIRELRTLSKMLSEKNYVYANLDRVNTRHVGATVAEAIAVHLESLAPAWSPQGPPWRSISTIPDAATAVLIAGTYPGGVRYVTKAHRNAQGEWIGIRHAPPTHWMALPSHPDP